MLSETKPPIGSVWEVSIDFFAFGCLETVNENEIVTRTRRAAAIISLFFILIDFLIYWLCKYSNQKPVELTFPPVLLPPDWGFTSSLVQETLVRDTNNKNKNR